MIAPAPNQDNSSFFLCHILLSVRSWMTDLDIILRPYTYICWSAILVDHFDVDFGVWSYPFNFFMVFSCYFIYI